MDSAEMRAASGATTPKEASFSMRLELVVLPVTDIERARRFYTDLGWHLDIDHTAGDDFRIVQFTPPGSD